MPSRYLQILVRQFLGVQGRRSEKRGVDAVFLRHDGMALFAELRRVTQITGAQAAPPGLVFISRSNALGGGPDFPHAASCFGGHVRARGDKAKSSARGR